ncbi:hypothetical protein EDB86DRAFT_3076863 [Lactarius hatsudake]|nr:hypothetical protein EDB86DRAFT_3076863 [Lactarius hatsudake]
MSDSVAQASLSHHSIPIAGFTNRSDKSTSRDAFFPFSLPSRLKIISSYVGSGMRKFQDDIPPSFSSSFSSSFSRDYRDSYLVMQGDKDVRCGLPGDQAGLDWRGDTGDIEWVEVFRQFTAVETLGVSIEFADSVAHAFKGITVDIATQVLPALDLLCLEYQPTRTIKKLFAIVRGCGRTLAIISAGEDSSESKNDPYW